MKNEISRLLIFLGTIVASLLLNNCDSSTDPAVPNKAPSCSISAPSNNAAIELGTTAQIIVSASDTDGLIANVKISIDDANTITLQSSPYNYDWSTAGVSLGQHNIKAVATDDGGLTATEQIIVNVTGSTTVGLPTLEIGFVTDVTHESANCSGEVTGDGGEAVIARGFVWAETSGVTLETASGFTEEGNGIGTFVSAITGLSPKTNYYIRAYATNSNGTAYAEPEIPFTTGVFSGPPIVKTLDVTNIGAHVALSGFEFVDDGGNNNIRLGIVWGTSPNPDINNNDGKYEPVWGVPIDPIYPIPTTSLNPETIYYVRAYGQTDNGVGYGEEKSFTTMAFDQTVQTGNFTDIRSNTQYNTVTINGQTWMAENLAYLPEVCAPDATCGYWVYDYLGTDVASAEATPNYSTYGVLYNWEMAKTVCPTGWHLPTHEEWAILEMNLGMSFDDATYRDNQYRGTDEGGKLKETGTAHWTSPNIGATNVSEFTAFPAGQRLTSGIFNSLGATGYFWSSDEFWPGGPALRYITNSAEYIGLIRQAVATPGYSVRCVEN